MQLGYERVKHTEGGQSETFSGFKLSKRYKEDNETKSRFRATRRGGVPYIVPSLPRCISQGETYEEALENIKEAIELYLEPDKGELLPYPQLKVMGVMV